MKTKRSTLSLILTLALVISAISFVPMSMVQAANLNERPVAKFEWDIGQMTKSATANEWAMSEKMNNKLLRITSDKVSDGTTQGIESKDGKLVYHSGTEKNIITFEADTRTTSLIASSYDSNTASYTLEIPLKFVKGENNTNETWLSNVRFSFYNNKQTRFIPFCMGQNDCFYVGNNVSDGTKGQWWSNFKKSGTEKTIYIVIDQTDVADAKVSLWCNNRCLLTCDEYAFDSTQPRFDYFSIQCDGGIADSTMEIGPVKFYEGDIMNEIAIDDVTSPETFAQGENTCTVSLKNRSRQAKRLVLYAATYCGDELIELKYTSKEITIDWDKDPDTISVTTNVGENDTSVKFMLWDGVGTPVTGFTPVTLSK